jgi:AcrR family transcriptional regulator
MGRWEPDTAARLRAAALELYRERGFDQTTVAEIAVRAGLTERTFFRHFADKREVLFGGSNVLQDSMAGALAASPASAPPIEQVTAALEAAAGFFDNRDYARQRQAVITANAQLQERELSKLAALSAALADILRQRDVPEPTASLTAEAAIAVFKVAFQCWIDDDVDRDFSSVMHESLAQLKAVIVPAGRQ